MLWVLNESYVDVVLGGGIPENCLALEQYWGGLG
jgi:hypothetical protein